MKKRYGIALAMVMALPATAMAGLKEKEEVFVDTASRYAYGSMGSARNSRDSNQYIGCVYMSGFEADNGVCSARDASGTSAFCNVVANEAMTRAISAISDSSNLAFAWDEWGYCVDVWTINDSRYEPRK